MEQDQTFCVNHPDRETGLSCNRCSKLICANCAVHTATGYRCKECIKEQKQVFDTAISADLILAFIISVALSYLGSLLIGMLGFFTFFLSPMVGIGIAEAVRSATGKRRSVGLNKALVIGVIVGGLPRILPGLMAVLFGGNFGALILILWPAVYVVMAASSAYSRFSGLKIR